MKKKKIRRKQHTSIRINCFKWNLHKILQKYCFFKHSSHPISHTVKSFIFNFVYVKRLDFCLYLVKNGHLFWLIIGERKRMESFRNRRIVCRLCKHLQQPAYLWEPLSHNLEDQTHPPFPLLHSSLGSTSILSTYVLPAPTKKICNTNLLFNYNSMEGSSDHPTLALLGAT